MTIPPANQQAAVVCRVARLPQQVQVLRWGSKGLGEPATDVVKTTRDPQAEQDTRHIQSLLGELIATVQDLEERRSQSISELQQLAIDLAVTVASAVAETAISQEEHGIDTLVQQAIKRMGVGDALVVGLHPRDVALLQKKLAETGSPWPENTVDIVADDSLDPGSVRVTRDGTGLLSRVQSRLSDIRRHLIEGLDDAQIERRNATGTDSLLRRFPNRRSSA
jgi:flagellar biosynthesis/type III secretory pathway protein FliH